METKEKDLSKEKFDKMVEKASENKTVIKQFTIKINFITDTEIKEEDCSPKLFKEAKNEYKDKISTSIRKWIDNIRIKSLHQYESGLMKISKLIQI